MQRAQTGVPSLLSLRHARSKDTAIGPNISLVDNSQGNEEYKNMRLMFVAYFSIKEDPTSDTSTKTGSASLTLLMQLSPDDAAKIMLKRRAIQPSGHSVDPMEVSVRLPVQVELTFKYTHNLEKNELYCQLPAGENWTQSGLNPCEFHITSYITSDKERWENDVLQVLERMPAIIANNICPKPTTASYQQNTTEITEILPELAKTMAELAKTVVSGFSLMTIEFCSSVKNEQAEAAAARGQ